MKINNMKKKHLINIGLLLLVNLFITTLIFIFEVNSNTSNKLQLFQIDWILSNSIGFSIFFFLNLLEFLNLKKWLKLIVALLAIFIGSFLGGFLGTKLIALIFEINISFFPGSNLIFFFSISMIFGISAYTIFILLGRINTKKIEWLAEKHARTEAELTSLRTRINPHFLFNTLNSISELIYISPSKADTMLQQLSELLRYNLNVADTKVVELSKELQAVKDYLEIEKIRFEDRLKYNINNDIKNFQLPPLLILTLVENAIKHGISPCSEGGTIDIEIKDYNGKIIISVLNNGKEMKPTNNNGFGLRALKKLLEIHYKNNANFSIKSTDVGTLAKIEIKNGKLNEI